MSVKEILESVQQRVSADAHVGRVYGEPVTVGDRTVIPVAKVGYGFGGGGGIRDGESDGLRDEGGGGGGGVGASAAGALEITADGTRFIEFSPHRKVTAALLIGIAAGLILGRLSR